MKQFTHRNDGFKCLHCAATVPPATGTCRNHCPSCLRSRHVDVFPGDRAAACGALMEPIEVIIKSASFYKIVHKCTRCHHQQKCRFSSDDSRESIMQLVEKLSDNNMKKE